MYLQPATLGCREGKRRPLAFVQGPRWRPKRGGGRRTGSRFDLYKSFVTWLISQQIQLINLITENDKLKWKFFLIFHTKFFLSYFGRNIYPGQDTENMFN